MGKSFKKNNYSENNNRSKSNEFKRRKNQVKEEHNHSEYSEYKIHGFKRKDSWRKNIYLLLIDFQLESYCSSI